MKHQHDAILFNTLKCLLLVAVLGVSGCGTTEEKKENTDFFTSGSREADQRATQRMAKSEQLADSDKKDGDEKKEEEKRSLYERLGGEAGIAKIVDDFLARALQDPRVNWDRSGVTRGGFRIDRNKSVSWNGSAENVAKLKKHMSQFFALASGGPPKYGGKEMKTAHADLQITNAEFDAAVGDLKASLDKYQVANREQKELLAIVESTRPQVVTVR